MRSVQKSAQTLVLKFRGIKDKGDGIPDQRPCTYLENRENNRTTGKLQSKTQQILPRESVGRCAQKSAQTFILEFKGIRDKADGIPKRRPALVLDLGQLGTGR